MLDKSKRNFIKYIASSSAFASLNTSVLASTISSKLEINSVNISKLVSDIWNKEMPMSPYSYLSQKSISAHTSERRVKEAIQHDFKNDKTILVNGFIISATEAALIATIVS